MLISDTTASTGRALELYTYGMMIVLHHYHSIVPGKYESLIILSFR